MWWGKLAVAFACLFAMLRILPRDSAPLRFIWIHPWYVAAAALLRPAFTLVMAMRGYTLTSEIVPSLQASTVIRATFIGQMANLVLPSGAGGDLVRGTILWRKSHGPWPQIVAVLVVDRLMGTLSLFCCTLVLSFPLLIHLIHPDWLGAGAGFAAALLAGAWFGRNLVLNRVQKTSLWHDTAAALKQTPRKRWIRAAFLALLGHVMLITSTSLVFSAVGIDISLFDRAGIVALSLFLSSLPLTLGGHGIREGTLVLLLAAPVAWTRWQPFAPMDAALALAAATWIIHVVTNFLGGLVALGLLRRNSGRDSLL